MSEDIDFGLDEALAHYYRLAEDMNKRIEAPQEIADEDVRDLAYAAAFALRTYNLPNNWNGNQPIIPLPQYLVSDIARHIQILAGGHIPQWMLHIQKKGRGEADPNVKQWIGLAVAYKKLCERGVIKDKSSTKTITDLYGISRRRVQNWVKDDLSEPELWFPEATDDAHRAELIKQNLPEYGEKYRLWGNGPKNANPIGKAEHRRGAKR